LLEGALRDAPLLLWQPIVSGAQQLSHLLRQRQAAALFETSGERSGTRESRERLRRGETLEVGGYAISPRLADDLEQATFGVPGDHRGRIAWLEVMASATPSLAPSVQATIARLRAGGADVDARALAGTAFWQSVEIEYCDPLIDASIAALAGTAHRDVSRNSVVL
jgi:hypothetical protein